MATVSVDTTTLEDYNDLLGRFDTYQGDLSDYEDAKAFYEIRDVIGQIVRNKWFGPIETPLYVKVDLTDDDVTIVVADAVPE